jgi:hypothetical protein
MIGTDASCTLTSLSVSDLENFQRLIFVAQSVHCTKIVSVKVADFSEIINSHA